MHTMAALLTGITAGAPPSVLHLDRAPRVGQTNDRYASWTIDSSYNRGFVHIHWDNPNLLAAATSLAPSTLRFGGSGNDYLHFCGVLSGFSLSGCPRRPRVIAHALYEEAYGLRPVSSVSVGLLGGLTCLLFTVHLDIRKAPHFSTL